MTIISKYPDMSKVVLTEKQLRAKRKFREAIAYAKGILADPGKKEAYQKVVPSGKSIFQFTIAEYMRRNKNISFLSIRQKT